MNTEELVAYWTPQDVAKTRVGTVDVSTVILRYGNGKQYAETMIFLNGHGVDGLTEYDCERGPIDGAQAQHDRWVAKVRQAVAR